MYGLAAGKGLYLQVMPTSARYWRLNTALLALPA
jgi:hypothetical protein